MTKLIAFDPGSSKPHAYALFDIKTEKLLKWGFVHNADELNTLIVNERPEIAIVEDQYVGRNSKTGIALAQATGGLVELLKFMGVAVELVLASTWTKAFMRWRKGWPPRSAYLKGVVKISKLSEGEVDWDSYKKAEREDLACAIQIGRWWLRRKGGRYEDKSCD